MEDHDMADAITLFSPVGTVKFDCTREPDRYYDGHTITLFFKDSDEGLEEFQNALLDYQYNTLGPDAEVKHPLLKATDGGFTIKAKTKYACSLVDHNDDPIEDGDSLRGRRARIHIDVKDYSADFGDGPIKGLTAYLKGVQVVSAAESDTDDSSTTSFGKVPKEIVESSDVPF